jgi:hypothetical protein
MGLVAQQEVVDHQAPVPENPHGFYVVGSSIGEPVHVAVWNISQSQIDLEKLLPKYVWTLWKFYAENGNPQSVEEKIKLLERIVIHCGLPYANNTERLRNLEYAWLCDENALNDDDFKSFCV